MTRLFSLSVTGLLLTAALGAQPPETTPARLLEAQRVALLAYPELRTLPTQLRLVPGPDGAVTVTFGEARKDRDDLLALTRPRTAVLVAELQFRGDGEVARATWRGPLAKTVERRALAGASATAEAVSAGGAQYPPSRREAFLDAVGPELTRLLGRGAQITGVAFGASEDGPEWRVTAETASGERVSLAFEPFGGRLVQLERGGEK